MVSWRALVALYTYARRGSATAEYARREVLGEYAAYEQNTHLLSLAVDELRRSNYLFLSAHGQRSRPPEPLARPGVQKESLKEVSRTPTGGLAGNHLGSGPVSKEEFHKFWNEHALWLSEQTEEEV